MNAKVSYLTCPSFAPDSIGVRGVFVQQLLTATWTASDQMDQSILRDHRALRLLLSFTPALPGRGPSKTIITGAEAPA